MIFGVYVALPKRNINIKYLPKIHVYSDVTPFYKILIRSTTIIIIIYTILFLWRHPLWRHSLFLFTFLLCFLLGKEEKPCLDVKFIAIIALCTSSQHLLFLLLQKNKKNKKKRKKKGKKLKCGTRIFRDNLNVSQKATQEKTNFSLRGGISSNTYNPLFQKKNVFLCPWYAGPLWQKGKRRIKT